MKTVKWSSNAYQLLPLRRRCAAVSGDIPIGNGLCETNGALRPERTPVRPEPTHEALAEPGWVDELFLALELLILCKKVRNSMRRLMGPVVSAFLPPCVAWAWVLFSALRVDAPSPLLVTKIRSCTGTGRATSVLSLRPSLRYWKWN